MPASKKFYVVVGYALERLLSSWRCHFFFLPPLMRAFRVKALTTLVGWQWHQWHRPLSWGVILKAPLKVVAGLLLCFGPFAGSWRSSPLSLGSFCFCVCVRFMSSTSSVLRRSSWWCFATILFAGGCLAIVVVAGARFGSPLWLCQSCGCFATIVVWSPLTPLMMLVSFSRFSWVVVSSFGRLCEVLPLLFLLFLLELESPATSLMVLCNYLNTSTC